jgi:hypothetical protein
MKLNHILALLFVFSFGSGQAQNAVGGVMPGKVGFSAFKLDKPDKVKISGTGGIYEDDWQTLVFYGWIIDSQTRKVVWHQIDVMDKMNLDYGEFDVNDEVSLNKGTYELYFAGAYVNRDNYWNGHNFFDVFSSRSETDNFKSNLPNNSFFGILNKVKFKSSYLEELGISVSGPSVAKTDASEIIKAKVSDAIVSILKPARDANIKNGFSLEATTSIRVYAIGEGRKKEQFDYAWIYDVDNHKRVWEMDDFNTDYAGGDDKNLMYTGTITLPAGNYILNYASDDSHFYNDWNAMPPSDPQFAGVTIWAETAKDKANVIPFKRPEEMKPVLEITKVRDDKFISKGISVKTPIEVRVLCIGEKGDDGMVDTGWIINAKTRNVVWDMNKVVEENAGGAEKNKMFDRVIKLEKGDYIVYYSTDDSHSYGDWNSGPPHEQDYWGITLWATRKEDIAKISTFDPETYKSGDIVAEIVRVRDNEYLSEAFQLSKDTKLRIVSIGEGDDDDMVDYAWIKNTETGRTVWDMDYDDTENAGGDHKNRRCNQVITLPKGAYKVYYKTDGSHSYKDWNAQPPFDQEKYGVSIHRESN